MKKHHQTNRPHKQWAVRDSNPQPMDYESTALTVELTARIFLTGLSIKTFRVFVSPLFKKVVRGTLEHTPFCIFYIPLTLL